MASIESELGALLDAQSDAIRMKDLDRLMALYSSDILYFDVVPPLQYAGSAALRRRFAEWFDGYQSTIDLDVRDLRISASGEIAVVTRLSRARGILKNGRAVGSWVRATSTCHKATGEWLVTHEHVSLPVDLESGTPAMGLTP